MKKSVSDVTITDMKIQDVTEEYLKNAVPGKGTLAYATGYQIGIHGKEVEIGYIVRLARTLFFCRRRLNAIGRPRIMFGMGNTGN